MSMRSMNKQSGLSLVSLIVVCVLLILVAVVGMKVVPDVIEYFSIVKVTRAAAQDPVNRNASVAEIRRDFEKRSLIDNIQAITSTDLDISKEGGEIVISFAYSKKIPLYGPVSLLIDFEGSTAK